MRTGHLLNPGPGKPGPFGTLVILGLRHLAENTNMMLLAYLFRLLLIKDGSNEIDCI